MPDHLERVASVLLAGAAVVVAATFAHREFLSAPARRIQPPTKAPEYVASWREAEGPGRLIGDSAAPVTIVEFADLECPFCKAFHERVTDLKTQYGRKIAVLYVHFPLSNHRFAIPAAQAAECAAEQAGFAAFVDVVYRKQDSLGFKTWSSYARDAGVADTVRFSRCMTATTRSPRIDQGRTLGVRVGVRATPTVLINGWRFFAPPSDSVLRQAVLDLMAGKQKLVATK